MALIVEDGTGRSDADSLVSLAEAETYLENYSDPVAWENAGDDERERALRLGTQYVQIRFNGRWLGRRLKLTQLLPWPRYDVFDSDGYFVPADSVPARVKHAVAEAAAEELASPGVLLPNLTSPGARVESFRIGPISESVTYLGAKTDTTRFPKIELLVADYVIGPGQAVRT